MITENTNLEVGWFTKSNMAKLYQGRLGKVGRQMLESGLTSKLARL
jgi:hypothetical protein